MSIKLQKIMNAELASFMRYSEYYKKSKFDTFEFEIRDRNGEFEFKIAFKNTRDVSEIEDKSNENELLQFDF